jgi:hypothetical protein
MYSVVIEQIAQAPIQAPSTSSVWEMGGVIAAAGATGGIANALLNSGNGYSIQWPRAGRNDVLQLGIVGNLLLGAFAALITWGLYGSLKDAVLLGNAPAGQLAANLTVTAVIGAIVAGTGGARVVSNELDKKMLRGAGAGAALQPANAELAVEIATLPAVKALAATNAQVPRSLSQTTAGGTGSPATGGAPGAVPVGTAG